jgi:hypothetical protein
LRKLLEVIMGKLYHIREGFSVKLSGGEVFLGGGVIELEDDIAAQHALRIELADDDMQAKYAQDCGVEALALVERDIAADTENKRVADEAAAFAKLNAKQAGADAAEAKSALDSSVAAQKIA